MIEKSLLLNYTCYTTTSTIKRFDRMLRHVGRKNEKPLRDYPWYEEPFAITISLLIQFRFVSRWLASNEIDSLIRMVFFLIFIFSSSDYYTPHQHSVRDKSACGDCGLSCIAKLRHDIAEHNMMEILGNYFWCFWLRRSTQLKSILNIKDRQSADIACMARTYALMKRAQKMEI